MRFPPPTPHRLGMGSALSSLRPNTEHVTAPNDAEAGTEPEAGPNTAQPVSVTETKRLLFYGKASPLSYAMDKCEVIPITTIIIQAERQAREIIAAREQGNLSTFVNEYRKTLDSLAQQKVRVRRSSITEVLPLVFEYLPLLFVLRLGAVCKEWRRYLGVHGINFIVYSLGGFLERGPGKVPLQFTTECLREITMGVAWQESGKELGATVRVADLERVKEAQGSDISGGSTWVNYCEKFGRVEDCVSDDLEVVFPDGERRWFAMKACEGFMRDRWIVRVPPGPYWVEMCWMAGSVVHLVTVLQELQPPSIDAMPWTLKPVWPKKSLKCEQVILSDRSFYMTDGQSNWQQHIHQSDLPQLGPQSGITNYTVLKGKPLVPDILFGHMTVTKQTPTSKLLSQVTRIESHFVKS